MTPATLFGSSTSDFTAIQLSARALVVFVFALALFRMLPRKSLGDTSVIDVLLTLLVGSGLSRALTGNAPLGPTLVAMTVLGLLWVGLSWLTVHSERISQLVKGRPMVVIREGRVDETVLRRVQMGRRDLEQKLRMQGYRRPEEVALAYVERNGSVSVLGET